MCQEQTDLLIFFIHFFNPLVFSTLLVGMFYFFSMYIHETLSFVAFFANPQTIQHFQRQPWSVPATKQKLSRHPEDLANRKLSSSRPAFKLLPLLRWLWIRWRQDACIAQWAVCLRLAESRHRRASAMFMKREKKTKKKPEALLHLSRLSLGKKRKKKERKMIYNSS